MFVRRFAAASCFMTLCSYRRSRMLAGLRVLPTAACDMKASARRFVTSAQAIASVATADSRACINPQPPAPPTAGGPPTNDGRQPCNLTQEKLIELLERNCGTPKYSLYFFNVASRKGDWKSWKSQYKDNLERCKDCGLKISEHCASTSYRQAPVDTSTAAALREVQQQQQEQARLQQEQARMLTILKEERQRTSRVVTRTQNKANLEAQNCWRAGASFSIESSKRPWVKKTKQLQQR